MSPLSTNVDSSLLNRLALPTFPGLKKLATSALVSIVFGLINLILGAAGVTSGAVSIVCGIAFILVGIVFLALIFIQIHKFFISRGARDGAYEARLKEKDRNKTVLEVEVVKAEARLKRIQWQKCTLEEKLQDAQKEVRALVKKLRVKEKYEVQSPLEPEEFLRNKLQSYKKHSEELLKELEFANQSIISLRSRLVDLEKKRVFLIGCLERDVDFAIESAMHIKDCCKGEIKALPLAVKRCYLRPSGFAPLVDFYASKSKGVQRAKAEFIYKDGSLEEKQRAIYSRFLTEFIKISMGFLSFEQFKDTCFFVRRNLGEENLGEMLFARLPILRNVLDLFNEWMVEIYPYTINVPRDRTDDQIMIDAFAWRCVSLFEKTTKEEEEEQVIVKLLCQFEGCIPAILSSFTAMGSATGFLEGGRAFDFGDHSEEVLWSEFSLNAMLFFRDSFLRSRLGTGSVQNMLDFIRNGAVLTPPLWEWDPLVGSGEAEEREEEEVADADS